MRDEGFTLIEIVVTVAIMGIIAWLLSGYMNRVKRLEAQQAAVDAAQQTKKYLADVLRRDFAFVMDPAQVQLTSMHDIRITRTKSQGNARPDPSQTYQVQLQARCASIPAGLQPKMASVNFTNLTSEMQKKASCAPAATLQCGSGTYPQIVIRPDAGGNIPVYPRKVVPDLQPGSNIFATPVGVLPCFELSGKQLKLSLDVFYLKTSSNLSLDLVGEKFFILAGTPSDVSIFQE